MLVQEARLWPKDGTSSMKGFFLPSITLAVLCFCNLNIAIASNALDVFLSSEKNPEERRAFSEIVKNQKQYSAQVQQKLEAFQKTRDPRINVLNKLLYLAAIIKSDKFVQPLVKMLEDEQYLMDECIYDCPIVFTLTVFAISTNWSPPASMSKSQEQNTKVYDLLPRIRYIRNLPLRREEAGDYIKGPGIDVLLEKAHRLSKKELIKQAGPENTDLDSRYAAAYARLYRYQRYEPHGPLLVGHRGGHRFVNGLSQFYLYGDSSGRKIKGNPKINPNSCINGFKSFCSFSTHNLEHTVLSLLENLVYCSKSGKLSDTPENYLAFQK
jgi:hypothetical protein